MAKHKRRHHSPPSQVVTSTKASPSLWFNLIWDWSLTRILVSPLGKLISRLSLTLGLALLLWLAVGGSIYLAALVVHAQQVALLNSQRATIMQQLNTVNQALQVHPTSRDLLTAKLELEYQLGNQETVTQITKTLMQLDPNNPNTQFALREIERQK